MALQTPISAGPTTERGGGPAAILLRNSAWHAPRSRSTRDALTSSGDSTRNLYWSYRRASALEDDVEPATLSLRAIKAPGPSPFDLVAEGELEARLELALGALPPQHREVLLLVIREGMKPAEAAEVCGVTAEALRQRLARARAALIQHMNLERPARRFGT